MSSRASLLSIALTGCLVIGLPAIAQSQLSMHLKVNRGERLIRYGEPVVVEIALHNAGATSLETYSMRMGSVGEYPKIVWRDSQGKTAEFKSISISNPGRLTLGPGQEYRKLFDITATAAPQLWSFDRPGTYTLQACYQSYTSGTTLQSNPVTIRIIDPPGLRDRTLVDCYRTTEIAALILNSNNGPDYWSEAAIGTLNKALTERELAYLRAPALYYLALALMAKSQDLQRKEGAGSLEVVSLRRVALQHLRDTIDQYEFFPLLESAFFHAGTLAEQLGDKRVRDEILAKARRYYHINVRSDLNDWLGPRLGLGGSTE